MSICLKRDFTKYLPMCGFPKDLKRFGFLRSVSDLFLKRIRIRPDHLSSPSWFEVTSLKGENKTTKLAIVSFMHFKLIGLKIKAGTKRQKRKIIDFHQKKPLRLNLKSS